MTASMTSAPADEPRLRGLSPVLCRAAAGLDTGTTGGVLVLLWVVLQGVVAGQYWWAKLNVVSAVFYGDAVFHMGLGRASLAGAALLLVVYALLGVGFALTGVAGGFSRMLIRATVFVLAWHLVADRWVWRQFHPFAPLYYGSFGMLPAHALYLLALSRTGRRFRALAGLLGDEQCSRLAAAMAPAASIAEPAAEPGSTEPAVAPESPASALPEDAKTGLSESGPAPPTQEPPAGDSGSAAATGVRHRSADQAARRASQ
jgi:hypothetical protein